MTADDDLRSNIPAYLANTLRDEERKRVERALESSPELREDLRFWKRVRRFLQFEEAYGKAGHPSAAQIVDYVEERLTDDGGRRLVESHLASCDACRQAVDAVKETYPPPVVRQRRREKSFFESLVELLTPPRFAFAVGTVAVVVLGLALYFLLSNRTSEWEHLRDSADRMLRNGDMKGAEEAYQNSLAFLKLESRELPFEAAPILDSLAVINSRTGYVAGAQYFFEQSLSVRNRNRGLDDGSLAWVFERLGALKKSEGDFLAAERHFRNADAIRELLAERNPDDPRLAEHRRVTATFALIPQVAFRSPAQLRRLPAISLEHATTHVSMDITIRQRRPETIRFVPTLTTAARRALPVPDTLAIDPSSLNGKSLNLTLSRRYFEDGQGVYTLQMMEIESTATGWRYGGVHTYSFRVEG